MDTAQPILTNFSSMDVKPRLYIYTLFKVFTQTSIFRYKNVHLTVGIKSMQKYLKGMTFTIFISVTSQK